MNDLTNDSPKAPETATGSNPTEQADRAAEALKSSVVADAHDLTDEAKHVAGDLVTHARKSAETQISSGKDRVAERLGSVAEAIRHTGEQLRTKDDETALTDYVVRAADQVEAAADYLKRRSLGDVMGDVGGYARREPALFLGGAFVLGLIGGRFLKSSRVQPAPVGGQSFNTQGSSAGSYQRSGNRQGGSRNTTRGPSTRSSGTAPGVPSSHAGQPAQGGASHGQPSYGGVASQGSGSKTSTARTTPDKPRDVGATAGASDAPHVYGGNGGSPKTPGEV